jgi:RNA polymerase sigma-70 factor, ECF subfamily
MRMHPLDEGSSLDSQALSQRIRAGDVAAFETAFRMYYPRLCSFARHRVGSLAAAEEIVQETFLRVWQNRQRLDPGQSLRAYLFRSVLNHSLNEMKHRQVENRWLQLETTSSLTSSAADDAAQTSELAAAVQQTLAALPERCRLIFTMSRDQGLTYAEIAEALGISIKTVETQMGRALKSLRTSLATYLA